jgi:hypothetical protein
VITTVHNLESVLVLDFVTARSELAEARLERSRTDTPGNRAAVAEVRARIDAMPDRYLAAGGLRR